MGGAESAARRTADAVPATVPHQAWLPTTGATGVTTELPGADGGRTFEFSLKQQTEETMIPLNEPSHGAEPEKPPGDLSSAKDSEGNNFSFAAWNPFLVRWLNMIVNDGGLSPGAKDVAVAIARAVRIGRVAITNWQRINASLGRVKMDLAVFETLKELEWAGYISRYVDEQGRGSWGFSLHMMKEEL